MDARTGYAAGGFAVGAAVVAVACAVTLSNTAALADTPGAKVGVEVVHVAAPSQSGTPTPHASAPVVVDPGIAAPPATAEVVPAPEPRDVVVAAPAPTAAASSPAAPPAEAIVTSPSRQEIESEALQTGSFDRLRAWAAANGWPQQRVDRWIENLQARLVKADDAVRTHIGSQKTSDMSEHESGHSSGSKRAQSPQPPRGD